MIAKKIIASLSALAVVALSILPGINSFAATQTYDQAKQEAFAWAKDHNLTAIPAYDATVLSQTATREQVAAYLERGASLFGLTANANATGCNFSDINAGRYGLTSSITAVCQMGIMQGNAGAFMPNDSFSRANLAVVLGKIAFPGYARPAAGAGQSYAEPFYAKIGPDGKGLMTQRLFDQAVTLADLFITLEKTANSLTDSSNELCSDPTVAALLGADFCNGTTPVTTPTSGTVITYNGDLQVALDAASPSSTKVPVGANAEAAVFDFTASKTDVTVSNVTVKAVGLGSLDALASVAASTDTNGRVSTARSFNSDGEATITFNPALVIKAGTTQKVRLVVTTSNTSTDGYFALRINTASDIIATANIGGNFPLTSAEHQKVNVTASTINVDDQGSVSNVSLGDTQAAVAKFYVENTQGRKDIKVSSITLYDVNGNIRQGLANYTLKAGANTVATVAGSTSSDYVTFRLATPLTLTDGQRINFTVYADVVGAPNDTIQLNVEDPMDVLAYEADDGYSVVANVSGYVGTAVLIKAGEVVISAVNLSGSDIPTNKKNVVLGSFKLTSNASALDLNNIAINFHKTSGTGSITGTTGSLQSIALQRVVNGVAGAKYTLRNLSGAAGNDETWGDTSLGISVAQGETATFNIIADTQNVNIPLSFTMSIAATSLLLRETSQNRQITDITPSTITFNTVNVVSSQVAVTSANAGSSFTAVVGSAGVAVSDFNVKAGSSSDLNMTDVTVAGTKTVSSVTTAITSNEVSQLSLYRVNADGTDGALLSSKGSLTSDGAVTFDGLNETIAANQTNKYRIKVDTVNLSSNGGMYLNFFVNAINFYDYNGITVDDGITGNGVASATLILTGFGTLSVNVDNTNTLTKNPKNVLAGTLSDYVATFQLQAVNEAINLKNFTVFATGTNFSSSVSDVYVYMMSGGVASLVAQKSVDAGATGATFTQQNITLPQGTTNLYVKVVTRNVGKGFNKATSSSTGDYALSLSVTKATGISSTTELTSFTPTGYAQPFKVVDLLATNVQFVASQGGYTTVTQLSNAGQQVLGILAITADRGANTNTVDNSNLRFVLSGVRINAITGGTATVSNLYLERIGGSTSTTFAPGVFYNPAFTITGDATFDPSVTSTVYYLVRGNVSNVAGAASASGSSSLHLQILANSGIIYQSDNTGTAAPVYDLRLNGQNSIETTPIYSN